MITKGSKIQLVKPIGIFDNIGEVCEVTNVTEDGVITFRFGNYHLGCMSYDEFEKYFVNYEEKVKETTKRTWSKWKCDTFIYYNFDGESYVVPVKYRNNGRVVELRTDWTDEVNLKTKASCSKRDTFDFDTGLDLADHRMQIKLMQLDLQDIIDEM